MKHIFQARKIIRTARRVVIKFSEKYPFQEIYEKVWFEKNTYSFLNVLVTLIWTGK